MKVAYLDCEFGAGGDMLNASLIAAGASLDHLLSELAKLNLPQDTYEISIEEALRCGVKCTQFNVVMGPDKVYELNLHAAEAVAASQPNETPGRVHREKIWLTELSERQLADSRCPVTLSGIIALIDRSSLSSTVKLKAAAVIKLFFAGQAASTGSIVDSLILNEMSATDLVIDVVSFVISSEYLKLEKIHVSPLPVGCGAFEYAGEMKFAGEPATLEVLKMARARISSKELPSQCLTPTAAAILAALATGWHKPAFEYIDGIGYGGGSYNPVSYPNVCRVIIGEAEQTISRDNRFIQQTIQVLEANIDDLSPQALAYATEQLFSAGALDVLVLPAVMKKGRSGHLLKILCLPEHQNKLQEIVFNETTTIGIRSYAAERVIADRRWQSVSFDDGTAIRIKTAFDRDGVLIHAQPEYEDCAVYAARHKLPLKGVIDEALARFRRDSGDSKIH